MNHPSESAQFKCRNAVSAVLGVRKNQNKDIVEDDTEVVHNKKLPPLP